MRFLHSNPVLALLLMTLAARTANAAPGRDSCRGYIDAVPASIGAEGTWCLRGHKYTSQTSGAAITVLADNVTIDCNHFRLSGLGAGPGTAARGVRTSVLRTTLRNCRIQGFELGVEAFGAAHLIEANRFELNTSVGVYVWADQSIIRDNEVLSTGGKTGSSSAIGIRADWPSTRISGNTVHGVKPLPNSVGDASPYGILAIGLIENNHVSGLDNGRNGFATGISAGGRSVIRYNTVLELGYMRGYGIRGSGLGLSVCRDNDVIYYTTSITECCSAGTNLYTAPINS